MTTWLIRLLLDVKTSDLREGLRESLWEYADGPCKDEITEQQHDKPRWIDTSAMICDPLTKFGPEQFASRLISTMESGLLDLTATASSQMKKMRQQGSGWIEFSTRIDLR